ncbi:hypothetical protein Sme01_41020 [Sphaerisporangium melleum]|uniref:N-acetyltransferase domain-containing protein n=1 Tax=Sphaerisporangium melleum TaxID=321316 RepID=A0A917RDH9_9ACTN|nr:GNAT family N-acetyltransferase [Sphaerisporangium melleum]GGL00969.1 hypothetical protein GCM10007964_48820 [Sphaerisporangium melleum]GII71626.1 hypothetical protein Sme01_41020 [Sphaerisporangium melleum]
MFETQVAMSAVLPAARAGLAVPVAPRNAPAVRIRPARPEDGGRVREFVVGLSPRTRSLRFFTGLTDPGAALLRAMTTATGGRDLLVALDAAGRIVGHAMSFTRDASTEIAVVVADEWQGAGVGSRLVRALLRRAAGLGASTVTMDVMGENRKVLSMVRRWWPDARMTVSSGTVEIVAALSPALRAPVTPA